MRYVVLTSFLLTFEVWIVSLVLSMSMILLVCVLASVAVFRLQPPVIYRGVKNNNKAVAAKTVTPPFVCSSELPLKKTHCRVELVN